MIFAASVLLFSFAMSKGVFLFLSCMDGSAPFASSDLMVSVWPAQAARCSGVFSYLFFALTSAPFLSRI